MSYALELTEPARSDLAQLDSWLQEETLDEIDRLANQPPVERRRVGGLVHDFVRRRGNQTFYVFLTIWPDANAGILRVKSIGLHVRTDDPSDRATP